MNRRPWIWLVAGTAEGRAAAIALLGLSIPVRVQLVSERARRPYRDLEDGGQLRCSIGALDEGGLGSVLRGTSDPLLPPPALVVDATHPFAIRITAALQKGCQASGIPYLRLRRPLLRDQQGEQVLWVDQLTQLNDRWILRWGTQRPPLPRQRLLSAIGIRALPLLLQGRQVDHTWVRILPTPTALRSALALGLDSARIALLLPRCHDQAQAIGLLEQALCRRWGSEAVLCRQSGGHTEAAWRLACRRLHLPLLLLRRPREPGDDLQGCGLSELTACAAHCMLGRS